MNSTSSVFNLLKKLPSLSKIDDHDLNLIIRCSEFHKVRTGKVLYYQSDVPENAYLVVTGKVKKIKYRSDETSILIGKAKQGEWLGVTEIILNSPYLNDAITETAVELIAISKGSFNRLLHRNSLSYYFLKQIAKSFYFFHGQIERNVPVHRLVDYIINNTFNPENEGAILFLRKTQDEISQAIGVTRETVNKYLNQFQRKGYINISRGSIKILDMDSLIEYTS